MKNHKQNEQKTPPGSCNENTLIRYLPTTSALPPAHHRTELLATIAYSITHFSWDSVEIQMSPQVGTWFRVYVRMYVLL